MYPFLFNYHFTLKLQIQYTVCIIIHSDYTKSLNSDAEHTNGLLDAIVDHGVVCGDVLPSDELNHLLGNNAT